MRAVGFGSASGVERAEQRIHAGTLAFGRLNLRLGDHAEDADRNGIDGLIFGLVHRTVAAGRRLRLLQSGLIHRELALTVMGIALIVVLLLAAPLYS